MLSMTEMSLKPSMNLRIGLLRGAKRCRNRLTEGLVSPNDFKIGGSIAPRTWGCPGARRAEICRKG